MSQEGFFCLVIGIWLNSLRRKMLLLTKLKLVKKEQSTIILAYSYSFEHFFTWFERSNVGSGGCAYLFIYYIESFGKA